MFREMRRKRQELEERDCIEILKKGQTGVLAVAGSDANTEGNKTGTTWNDEETVILRY